MCETGKNSWWLHIYIEVLDDLTKTHLKCDRSRTWVENLKRSEISMVTSNSHSFCDLFQEKAWEQS